MAPPSLLRLVSLALLAGLLWLASLRLLAGSPAEFNSAAIPNLGWYVLAALLMALLLDRLSRPLLGLRWGAVIVLALVPGAVLVQVLSLFLQSPQQQRYAMFAALALAAVFMLNRTRHLTGQSQWRAVAAVLVTAACFSLVNAELRISPDLWTAGASRPIILTNSGTTAVDPAELEALLFEQPQRVDQALQRLGPRELGASAFFLGFAGYAEEKVFAEEIKYAARVMADRYGSGQRTLLLLNDARDLVKYPLASVSSLEYAITGMAAKMELEEDLLILALSSHGSESAELAVDNSGLPLRLLNAATIRRALDEAGVRWRLLVVSACFAGSFIEALADPHTAIITAAAPDRTSFGCSNQRDLTYFGEAFYRDALPESASLRAAFDRARELVTERERAIDITPSKPVAYFGDNIEAKLQSLAQ